MGTAQSQFVAENQTISNQVLQESRSSCKASCQATTNGNTIIIIGGSGDVDVTSECMLDAQCVMANTFNVQLDNILKAVAQQDQSAMNGLTFDFTSLNGAVDIRQAFINQISQVMDSSCTLFSSASTNDNFFYAQGRNGNINISSVAQISQGTCNMANVASAVTYNSATADSSQKQSTFNILSLLFLVIIIAMVLAAIVCIVFILTGGVKTLASAASSGSSGGIPGKLPISVGEVESLIARNPELLAL